MTAEPVTNIPTTSLEVRKRLVEALKLDLVGPWAGHELAEERLPGWVRPSSWYLNGFLIPSGTPPEKAADADADDDLEVVPESAGTAEESIEDRKAAKKGYFPSSMGLTFLVPKEADELKVTVRWGDYDLAKDEGSDEKRPSLWQRVAREENVNIPLTGSSEPTVYSVPASRSLQIHVVERPIEAEQLNGLLPAGTCSVSVFFVNHRKPNDEKPDLAYAFQAQIEVRSDHPFVARPNLRRALAEDWDEQIADLHYADAPAYATGHGVSAEWDVEDSVCHVLRTEWIPSAEV